ncbi:hypothetical protein AN1590.2 [Aspergillus nidulans FGSC A4]|uniref:Nephrocystin 3-like N-terminal domain-containing protein n=1 Tax=Emericella nidulans (strain FGSC A4 / ATCC 38163 / CBS 112.46 / NRRL 194 / M139) TaxID=227321 RepID=Q5BCZ0_EMENI|nr:hypothetical protein [Aspergillus nidulans FGSC A4]EAA64297.1 hypothetical protein AN1590.2 [Aspergillus nidulans FGSC A4]CBF85173.1 TPA: conserved hypothetical protein [Aspergillus nidulans FGSC A4]|eukprot:XP_659194.1 hypothetical protein AN1590.2 [Aspergillus nidulans FGSC A4]
MGKEKHHFSRLPWRKSEPATDEDEAWIRKKAGAHHPAFRTPADYDRSEKRYISDEEQAIEYLENLLRKHDDSQPGEPKFYQCSWEVVIQSLTQAQDAYAKNTGCGQRTGMALDVTLSAFEALPAEFGLGTVKGILGLMFRVALQGIENRAKILDAFSSIPNTIVTINVACTVLRPSQGDLDLREEFYRTLIKGMPLLVDVLLRAAPWYRKLKEILLFRIPETVAVDEVLSEWKGIIDSFNQRMQRMRDRMLGTLHQQGVDLQNQADKHFSATENHFRGLREENSTTHDMMRDLQLMMTVIMYNQKQLSKQKAQEASTWHHGLKSGADATTLLYQELQAIRRQGEIQQEENSRLRRENVALREEAALRAETESSWKPTHPSMAALSELELLGVIGVPSNAAWRDLDIVLSQSSSFGSQMLGKAQRLIRTRAFRDWFNQSESSILLVEGYLDISPAASITPISILDATLISSLLDSSNTLVLFAFAGLHREYEKPEVMNGPGGLLRSLIMQLLTSDKFPLSNLEFLTPERIAACQKGDIVALCALFERLLLQVPPSLQVYCILDGLGWYERNPWGQDLLYVISMFEELAQWDFPQTAVIKPMISFPHHSLLVADAVQIPVLWSRRYWD